MEKENQVQNDTVSEMDNGSSIDASANYIETIKNLKANSVSKEEYDKLMDQNKQLLDTLVKGGTVESTEATVVMSDQDLKKLIEETSRKEMTNLDYVRSMLTIRKEMMAKGLEDPMAPKVVNHTNDDKDYEKAKRVAEFLQECVDEANGDNDYFKALFQAGIVDPKITAFKKK